jgi:hypothetical protein
MSEWRETGTAFVRIRDDYIVEARMKDGVVETLETAKRNLELGNELVGEGEAKPMLLVLGGMLNLSSEARRFYAECERYSHDVCKIAIVMDSYISRVIGNVFIGLSRTETPISLFTDEGKAVTWLKKPIKK